MKTLLAAAILLIICPGSRLSAQEEEKPSPVPILIENSQSPDGRKEITITDMGNQGIATGLACIRDLKTQKSLGCFDWSGFGEHPTKDTFEVLWRPDSRAFAIKYELTRGYVTCEVYVLLHDGKLHKVPLPDFVQTIARKYHLETYPKGGEHPKEWLPDNRLAIDVYNRAWPEEGEGDTMQPYRVILGFSVHDNSSSLSARITSIHPAHEQDFAPK